RFTTFDKKNYYYPDLSNSYQITQMYAPICTNGWIEINTSQGKKKIGIKQIHMEEDAGKLIHDDWQGISLVDYNRCSVPLVEIVSNPDFRSAEEVIAYLEKLRSLLRFAQIARARFEEGSIRCDVNISVRQKGDPQLGVRTEIKNMNSLSAIQRAIAFETERHIDAIEWGEPLVQETRRWDDAKNQSFAMRDKENAGDYFYFPDPDLTPIEISQEWIDQVAGSLPEMPDQKRRRYSSELEIKDQDAELLIQSPRLAAIFEQVAALCGQPQETANWLVGEGLALAKKNASPIEDITLNPNKLAYLIRLVNENTLTRANGKRLFAAIFAEDVDPDTYIKEHQLDATVDSGALEQLLQEIVAANPKSVSDYRAGKTKALDFLFGQAMRTLKGTGDPGEIKAILSRLLG
ncbi:MAG: Asp-tRNA(Asn)/Glu-tRNA(Gln) amidotransferase subunit GatB, partial [Clostridiales bacterium]